MTVFFPNKSRNFNKAKEQVSFIGHDDLSEVEFRVDIAALIKIDADVAQDEHGYLTVFDKARPAIERVARRAYMRKKGRMILLTASDIH